MCMYVYMHIFTCVFVCVFDTESSFALSVILIETEYPSFVSHFYFYNPPNPVRASHMHVFVGSSSGA